MLLLLSHVLLLAGDWKKVEHPPEEGVEGATPTYARVRLGSGKFIHGDYKYEGEFVDDQMSGKGVFKFASGRAMTASGRTTSTVARAPSAGPTAPPTRESGQATSK